MDNAINNIRISRTDAFMDRFNTRMKFLVGSDVQVGKEYKGWETTDDNRYDGVCKTIQYDGRYLYVFEEEHFRLVMLYGDMADYQGRLIADRHWSVYDVRMLQKRIQNYMRVKGIQDYTTEVGRSALWLKMAPQELIMERVHVYKMTKDVL